MKHRHLDIAPGTTPEQLPSAAIVDLLERGDLSDWSPLLRAIARAPFGEFAERSLRLVDAYPMYGTSPLLRSWIRHRRDLETGRLAAVDSARPVTLAAVRKRMGLTQAEVAARMEISQSDLSKLERRADLRLSTLRAYATALGVDLQVALSSRDGGGTLLRIARDRSSQKE